MTHDTSSDMSLFSKVLNARYRGNRRKTQMLRLLKIERSRNSQKTKGAIKPITALSLTATLKNLSGNRVARTALRETKIPSVAAR